MSIDVEYIEGCLQKGRLFEVPLISPDLSERRRILATPKLMAQIDGTAGGGDRRFVVELRADLDDFLGGKPITVGGPKDKNAYMKPLLRSKADKGFGGHEVWEIRSRDPKPAIRVFGRFARRDVFVATDWEHRAILGGFGSLLWRREIRRCKHDWRAVFGTREAHTGGSVHDYISDPVIDLRDSE